MTGDATGPDPAAAGAFGRVVTAMITPFDADGAVDLDTLAEVAGRLVELGNDGLVVSGTTGESPTTTDEEKLEILRVVLEAVGDRARITAGVGGNDTRHTIESAVAARDAGAHGVLAVTPYYNKPPQEGIRQHFLAVADAIDVPVMLYDIPGRTGVPITTDTLVRVAEHPRIVAVKDAKADLYESAWVMARSDLAYYSGDDGLNLVHLANGATGVVSVVGHLVADRYAEMVAAVDVGDLARARQVQRSVLPLVRGVMTRTQGAIMVKAAMQMQGRLGCAVVRPPLVQADDGLLDLLRADLTEAGVL